MSFGGITFVCFAYFVVEEIRYESDEGFVRLRLAYFKLIVTLPISPLNGNGLLYSPTNPPSSEPTCRPSIGWRGIPSVKFPEATD